MCLSGCSTTAAATTGPARHPRPTSSTPATCTNPTRRNAFSSVRMAGTRVMGGMGWKGWKGGMRNPDSDASCLSCPSSPSGPPLSFRGVLHPRRLALEIAQVVELCAPDSSGAHHFHLLDRRRVEREDALDALAERDLPNRERGARAAAVQ